MADGAGRDREQGGGGWGLENGCCFLARKQTGAIPKEEVTGVPVGMLRVCFLKYLGAGRVCS